MSSNMQIAFVASPFPLSLNSFNGSAVSFRRVEPSTTSSCRSVVRAVVETQPDKEAKEDRKFNKVAKDHLAKAESEYRGVQGFTPYAEIVNGRLAQFGFALGLITELFGKGHPTIGQQILIMFSPLTKVVTAVVSSSGNLPMPGA